MALVFRRRRAFFEGGHRSETSVAATPEVEDSHKKSNTLLVSSTLQVNSRLSEGQKIFQKLQRYAGGIEYTVVHDFYGKYRRRENFC